MTEQTNSNIIEFAVPCVMVSIAILSVDPHNYILLGWGIINTVILGYALFKKVE